MQENEIHCGDSLGWEAPKNLAKILADCLKYTGILEKGLNISIRTLHAVKPKVGIEGW